MVFDAQEFSDQGTEGHGDDQQHDIAPERPGDPDNADAEPDDAEDGFGKVVCQLPFEQKPQTAACQYGDRIDERACDSDG